MGEAKRTAAAKAIKYGVTEAEVLSGNFKPRALAPSVADKRSEAAKKAAATRKANAAKKTANFYVDN